jgi:hypothetical protein
MVEELAPALRYCNYQISRAGGEAVDPAGLLALAEEGGEGGGSLLQVRRVRMVGVACACFNKQHSCMLQRRRAEAAAAAASECVHGCKVIFACCREVALMYNFVGCPALCAACAAAEQAGEPCC